MPKETTKKKSDSWSCFEKWKLNRRRSVSATRLSRIDSHRPNFMSESLTFPRHLLTFVDTCKQRGVSASRGQKVEREQWWSNVNRLRPSVAVAPTLSAKVRRGTAPQWSPLLCTGLQSAKQTNAWTSRRETDGQWGWRQMRTYRNWPDQRIRFTFPFHFRFCQVTQPLILLLLRLWKAVSMLIVAFSPLLSFLLSLQLLHWALERFGGAGWQLLLLDIAWTSYWTSDPSPLA